MDRAPFETFEEHAQRTRSAYPYSEAFIRKCREKALKYDFEADIFLKDDGLRQLREALPEQYHARVFDGISDFNFPAWYIAENEFRLSHKYKYGIK